MLCAKCEFRSRTPNKSVRFNQGSEATVDRLDWSGSGSWRCYSGFGFWTQHCVWSYLSHLLNWFCSRTDRFSAALKWSHRREWFNLWTDTNLINLLRHRCVCPAPSPGRLAFSELNRSVSPMACSFSFRLKLSSTLNRGTWTETVVSFISSNQSVSFFKSRLSSTWTHTGSNKM